MSSDNRRFPCGIIEDEITNVLSRILSSKGNCSAVWDITFVVLNNFEKLTAGGGLLYNFLMEFIIFLLAVFFLVLSAGYLYREDIVIKIHAFINFFIFNDSYVLHYKRRVGVACLLISLYLFFLILHG